jgi:hypothetical protein
MDVSALLPGVATVLLALFGGAGGSLLLELWWNPWRARRRVAALLAEEVNLNAQLLTLHVHLRRKDPGRIAADFSLIRLAFDAVAPELGVLPASVAGQVLVTYHYFERLQRLREMFSERSRRWQEAEAAGQSDAADRKRDVIGALDSFNVLVDIAHTEAARTLALLWDHAPKREQRVVSDAEYAQRVATSEADRIARVKRLEQDVQ